MMSRTIRLIVTWTAISLGAIGSILMDGQVCSVIAGDLEQVAPPTIPARFFGTVNVDGQSAAEGIELSASIDGITYATTAIRVVGDTSIYVVTIPDSTVDEIELPEGSRIVFNVGGSSAKETGIWHSGAVTGLNLAVSTRASPPIATRVKGSQHTYSYEDIYQPRRLAPPTPVRTNVAPRRLCSCGRSN